MRRRATATGDLGSPQPVSKMRRTLTWTWVAGVVLFTVGRIVVAWGTLREYGINLWVFAVIDLVTAVPYALGVARVVTAVVDGERLASFWWAVVAFVSFFAPYAYLFAAGAEADFPTSVFVVLGALLVGFGAYALWGILREVRLRRAS